MSKRMTPSTPKIAEWFSENHPGRLVLPSIRWVVFIIGAIYFIWAAHAAAYSPSMDYAVVVEMARNMASGTDFPVFFYGQAYMGSLEPAVSALLCLLFGPSPFCVCLGTAILGIAALLVTMQVGKKLAGEWGGILSLAFAVTGGSHWIHYMVSPRGGYALASLLVISSIALASIGDFINADTGRIRISASALFGFIAGLAFWNFWITLPAFAAAVAVLLVRLRLRVFSQRFTLPCTFAFFIGSAPWWAWNIRNGFGSLDTNGSGPMPRGWLAIRNLFSFVIPKFYNTSPSAPSFWHSPIPWTLAAILLLSVASILAGRSKARKTFLLATSIYTALFAVAYAKSSFGSLGVARYLVPFVPVFSVLCGSALGGLARCERSGGNTWGKALRVAVGAIVCGMYALAVATPSVRSAIASLKNLETDGRNWRRHLAATLKDPSLSQAAFADFSLFGYNWASNRRLCFVSPFRWRYAPYLEQLEDTPNPAVINNYHSFRTFCKASGGTWRDREVTRRIIVSDCITSPLETEEVSFPATPLVKTADGKNVAEVLFDDNFATGVQLLPDSSGKPYLDVFFDSTPVVTGVSILMDSSNIATGWQVDFIGSDGAISPGIAEDPHCGWFWSGPRPYQFSPGARWTIRWEAGRIATGVRISFSGNMGMPIFIPDLRLLSSKPLPPLDLDAVKAVARTARQNAPDLRIHAGRWLGRQLGAPPDPAIQFGKSSQNLGLPDVCGFVTPDLSRPNLFIFRDPNAAVAATDTLRSQNLGFEKTEAGGCIFISIPSCKATADRSFPLRFIGGHLMLDIPPPMDIRYEPKSIDFGGMISLVGLAPLPAKIHPGETVNVDMVWQFSQKISGKTPLYMFIHGIQNGRIAFQAIVHVNPVIARRPADRPHPNILTLQMSVPENIQAGEVTFAVGIKKDSPLALRIKPTGQDIVITSRRAILGNASVVTK